MFTGIKFLYAETCLHVKADDLVTLEKYLVRWKKYFLVFFISDFADIHANILFMDLSHKRRDYPNIKVLRPTKGICPQA